MADEATIVLGPSRLSPRRARRFVASTLVDWGCPGLVPTVELLTSELVTNAVVHAGTEVALVIRATTSTVRVAVHDDGEGIPRARQAPALATNGRGLAMVDKLAERWGVLQEPTGKSVWFEVAR